MDLIVSVHEFFIYFDTSCKLSLVETFGMKSESLLSDENKKNINLSSAELAKRIAKIKYLKI